MASASNSSGKRALESKAEDGSVPTPKRACDGNSNVDNRQKMIQSLKENPASAIALSKMMTCDACHCYLRAPIQVCGQGHKICSNCFREDHEICPVEACTEEIKPRNPLNGEMEKTIRAMKLPVGCKNRKYDCPKMGEEKEIEDHETECGFRYVRKWYALEKLKYGGTFNDILCYVKEQVKISNGIWQPYNLGDGRERERESIIGSDEEGNYHKDNGFYRFYNGPDGHIFCIDLDARDKSLFRAHAAVIGGEHVAKKYRVELRLHSSEMASTLTYHGPVYSVDFKKAWMDKEAFTIDKKKFALFNFGVDHFGNHNKDKNGEIHVPIMVKIIKKELDIPQKNQAI